MYELLVLSLLMHWPLHAYRLAKIAGQIVGPEDQISAGTLSALLKRLEENGLIAPAAPGTAPFPADRPSRVFAITAAGRDRFTQLMLDTTLHWGSYRRLFHIKALHLEFLAPDQQLVLVEHYIDHYRQMLNSKQLDTRDMMENPLKQEHMSPAFRAATLAFMQLKAQQWQLEVAWAQTLREQMLARLAESRAGTTPAKEAQS